MGGSLGHSYRNAAGRVGGRRTETRYRPFFISTGRHTRLRSTGGRLVVLGTPHILQSESVALVTATPVLSGHPAHYPSIQKSLFPIYSTSYIISSPQHKQTHTHKRKNRNSELLWAMNETALLTLVTHFPLLFFSKTFKIFYLLL